MTKREDMPDRELLIRIDERVENIMKRQDDHGRRLKALEISRNVAAGAGAVVGVVISWVKIKVMIP